MRKQTRKMILNLATGVAIAATAGIIFTPASVLADPGVTTGNVNIRSGPGMKYTVLGSLVRGQSVNIVQCQGPWCYVEKKGKDRKNGWVAAKYLSASKGGGGNQVIGPVNPPVSVNPGFGISIGSNGISIGIGNTGPKPRNDEVCFYSQTNYRGSSFCAEPGSTLRNLGQFEGNIASISNPAGYSVRVCATRYLDGCRTYVTSARSLGNLSSEVSSIRID